MAGLVLREYADVAHGRVGHVLDGAAGNDILVGGAGADTLIGGAGAAVMPETSKAIGQYGVGGMFECMDALRAALAKIGGGA